MAKKISNSTRRNTHCQTDLYSAVEGSAFNQIFLLANYYALPFDAEAIRSCVIEVNSFPDRTEWIPTTIVDTWVQSITALASGGVLLGTSEGSLFRVINDTVEEFPLSLSSGIIAIWERSPSDYRIFHSTGIARWDGRNTIAPDIQSGRIFAVHAPDTNFAVAVGEAGLVMVFDGETWTVIDTVPTKKSLNGVVSKSADEIYITGWDGVFYRWDGEAEWKKIKYVGDVSGEEIYGGSLACYHGVVYQCAEEHGLYKVSGTKALPAETFFASRAMVLHDKLLVAGEQMLREFNGYEWIEVEIAM